MKLLIDIGNTNTSMAIADGDKFLKRFFIHTSKKDVAAVSLKRLLSGYRKKIDTIVIVSVVPEFLSILEKSIRSVFPNTPVIVVGRDINVPIKIKYKDPSEVGQDRLVVSYAASHIYSSPVLIVDFGTAVTFDFVDKKGYYAGGLIFPGIRLGLAALSMNTALLPEIDLISTKGLIGRDTQSSMNKGIIFGYSSMCDGIIRLFREKYGRNLKIVATGGDAGLIARYSSSLKMISPDLIFTGLSLLSE